MNLILSRKFELILCLLWIFVQLIVFSHFGIVSIIEAKKYIEQASILLHTGEFSQKYIFYSITILLIAFSTKMGFGFVGVVIVQIAFNGLATTWLYKIALKASGNNHFIARVTTFLFIIFLPIQSWNTYLYTESIFISATIGLAYVLITRNEISLKNILSWLGALLLVVFSRPLGLLFIPPFLVYVMASLRVKYRLTGIAVVIIGMVFFYLLINYAFRGGYFNVMKPFIEEHIICFIPTVSKSATLSLLNSGNPFNDVVFYIFNNPYHFLKLFFRRLFAFFILYRPYYSFIHNAYLISNVLLIYPFAIIGARIFIRRDHAPFRWFVLSLIVLYSLAIPLQCDDYHSRFIMPLFPYFFLLFAFGIEKFLNKRRFTGS